MSEVDRRFEFIMADEATADLRELRYRDRDAFDEIIILLQELRNDIRACEQLTDEHHSDDVISIVKPFEALQRERLNAYIVKLYEAPHWRIITACDHRAKKVAILAFMNRNVDYEKDAEFMERLKGSYEALEFTTLG